METLSEELEILKKIGLSDNEVKVYLALLDSGSASAGSIAKLVGMHRSDVYDTLERLCRKGFACSVKGEKTKNFKVTDVNVCLLALEEKQEELEKQKEQIKGLLPELLGLHGLVKESGDVRILRGKLGIKALYEDILRKKVDYWDMGLFKGRELMSGYFNNWDKRRISLGIRIRGIMPSERREFYLQKQPGFVNKHPLREWRFLPKEQYTIPMSLRVYGENVAMTIWAKKEPVVIWISDEDVAHAFNAYFEMLWKIAKPLKAK